MPGFLAATNMFAGTSNGSMVALFIASRMPQNQQKAKKESLAILKDAIEFSNCTLRAMAPTVGVYTKFLAGIGPIYDTDRLAQLFQSAIGNMTLGQLERYMAVAVSMSMNEFQPRSFVWIQKFLEHDREMLIADAMLASSSLPLFCSLYGNWTGDHYLDGAFVANNPSMVAATRILEMLEMKMRGGVLPVGPRGRHAGHPEHKKPATARTLSRCRILSLGVNDSRGGMASALEGNRFMNKLLGSPFQPGMLSWGWWQLVVNRPRLLATLLYQGQNREIARQCAAVFGLHHFHRYAPFVQAFATLGATTGQNPDNLIKACETCAKEQTHGDNPKWKRLVRYIENDWTRARQ